MLSYSFMLLAFFTAPALGSAVGGYRSLPKGAAERALGVDHGRRGDTWWWGGRAGLSRARSGFRRRSGCSVINGSGGATTREGVGSRVSRSNAVHKREPRGGSLAVAEGLARCDNFECEGGLLMHDTLSKQALRRTVVQTILSTTLYYVQVVEDHRCTWRNYRYCCLAVDLGVCY